MSVNKVILLGRIGQDLEKKTIPSGDRVIELSLATSEKWTDKDGNKQEKTEWSRVVFWNKQADTIAQYCKKGDRLYIEGSLDTEKWQDKDGNDRYTTKIKGNRFDFIETKGDSQGQAPPPPGGTTTVQTPNPNGGEDDFIEDDIPF